MLAETTSLANFTVTGNVDVVANNTYGITTPGGNVIDLDGTAGPGELVSGSFYAFNAGDVVTLGFLLGGAQRGAGFDDASFLLESEGRQNRFSNAVGFGYFSFPLDTGSFYGASGFVRLASTDPFLWSGVTLTAASAGSFNFRIGTNSSDNIGPLLAGVQIDITPTAVPEPATGGLMLLGLGLLARARRRRLA